MNGMYGFHPDALDDRAGDERRRDHREHRLEQHERGWGMVAPSRGSGASPTRATRSAEPADHLVERAARENAML